MDAEVLGYLLDRHPRATIPRDPHDILAELFGIGLGHSNILPTCPTGQASSDVTRSCSRPKVLQAASSANGAKVVQQPRDAGISLQNWFLILDDPYNSFENFESGLNLGIDGASTASGTAAITATGSGDLNQDWTRDGSAYSGDYVALKNRKSGLCLGISGASTANGAQAAQFPCDGSANQGWLLTH